MVSCFLRIFIKIEHETQLVFTRFVEVKHKPDLVQLLVMPCTYNCKGWRILYLSDKQWIVSSSWLILKWILTDTL